MLSCSVMSDSVTPWIVAIQAPQSMEFPRKEYWSGLPFPSPGDFPNPGIEHRCPALKADFLPSEPPGSGLLFHTPGDLPNPGIKPKSPTSPGLAGRFFTTVPPTTNCCNQVCAKQDVQHLLVMLLQN